MKYLGEKNIVQDKKNIDKIIDKVKNNISKQLLCVGREKDLH